MNQQMVVLEFNELSMELMNRFIERGYLPNFGRLRDQSEVWTTEADASGEDLNPWVQWVSVHTGIDREEHGVTSLNEAAPLAGKFLWDTLSSRGLSSWICGSMNVAYGDGFKGHLLPDPWAKDVAPHPAGKFDPYLDFVASAVTGHSAGGSSSMVSFAKCATNARLRVSTIGRIARQLLAEQRDPSTKWRRASILDWIQFDLFRQILKKEQSNFSTFFLNSTAHYQHHYWAEMQAAEERGDFDPDGKAGAILFGYRNMDAIVGECLDMASQSGLTVVLCTALGQQSEPSGSTESARHYYHLHDSESFSQAFGVDDVAKHVPLMAEQFQLHFDSDEAAQRAERRLAEFEMDGGDYFHVGGQQVFLAVRDGQVLGVQCRCTKLVDQEAGIIDQKSGNVMPFYKYFFHMNDVKSGRHHPLGMLWIAKPGSEPCLHAQPVSLESVHERLLAHFEPVPAG